MASQSIMEVFGTLPSGKSVPVSLDTVSEHIRDNYLQSDAEKTRQQMARNALALYNDGGEDQIGEVLDVFKDPIVKARRKEFIEIAMFQNVTKRLTNETSTVYSEKAKRIVTTGDDNYQQILQALRLDKAMRKVNRYTNLLNECLIWFRVRQSDRTLTKHVITPDRFFAIAHPFDPTHLIAIGFSSRPQGVTTRPTDPHWAVWTDFERFALDENGRVVPGSYAEHGLGTMPGVLVHREEPDTVLLNPFPGRDLTRAHKAVALLNVLMLKDSKSGGKMPYVVGDIGQTATGQTMDTENVTVLQEGITPGTLDLGADPRAYIEAAQSALNQIAANRGVSADVYNLNYQATSGFEIELKRVGLRELRRDQILDYRDVEHDTAAVIEAVVAADLPELNFDSSGLHVNFGEVETPQDPAQKLLYWKELRRMGLMSTVAMAIELNPEFSLEEAVAFIEMNIKLETARIALMRDLQAMGAGLGTTVDDPIDAENDENELEEPVEGRNGPPPNVLN